MNEDWDLSGFIGSLLAILFFLWVGWLLGYI
jgi:hypothetical protein